MDLGFSKLGATLGLVAGISAGFMASMIASSPALAGSMNEVSFLFSEMARAVGDELAPILEDNLIPVLSDLKDWFVDSPPIVKKFIAVLAATTVAVTALTIAVAALSFVSLPLLAIIVGLVMWITVLYMLISDWDGSVAMITSTWKKFHWALKALLILFFPIIAVIWLIVTAISVFDNVVSWLNDKIMAFAGWLVVVGRAIGTFFNEGPKMDSGLIKLFQSLGDLFGWLWGLVDTVGMALGHFFVDMGEKMYDLAIDAFNWGAHLIEMFIAGASTAWDLYKGFWGAIADTIADFLGFSSPPPLGALNKIASWGPHMMETYMKGIESMKGNLSKTMAGVSETVSVGLTSNSMLNSSPLAIPSTSPNYSASSTSINNTIHVTIDRPVISSEYDANNLGKTIGDSLITAISRNTQGGRYR